MASSKIDPDLIRELASLLDENRLTEIEWSEGGRSVRVVRNPSPATVLSPAAAPAATGPSHDDEASEPSGAPALHEHPGAVRSPMVGTVYVSPEPDADAFISEGDRVSEGQTLLIVEAMKTMNPIPAPRGGVVQRILVADATPVEYGQALLILE
jgi:acetyl-CoA carboxylase biotin carboxyl carrier protein